MRLLEKRDRDLVVKAADLNNDQIGDYMVQKNGDVQIDDEKVYLNLMREPIAGNFSGV